MLLLSPHNVACNDMSCYSKNDGLGKQLDQALHQYHLDMICALPHKAVDDPFPACGGKSH